MDADIRDRGDHGAKREPAPRTDPPQRPAEAAEQSLADALRVSFRVLTVIMVFIVIAFLLTGVKIIGGTQRGIIMRFGEIIGTAGPGLAYTWPFPIGSVEKLEVKEKALTIDDFWMHETPEDRLKEFRDRTMASEGLRPGWDGSLLTADRYVLHAKLNCKYAIENVEDFKRNVVNEAGTIRSVVCDAAIRAAAIRTGDHLQRAQIENFKADVLARAQQALDELRSGIRIRSIEVPQNGITWPLRALRAFDDVVSARNEMEGAINEARADAGSILRNAAGESYKVLVGEPWKRPSAGSGQARGRDEEQRSPLIDAYATALSASRRARAEGRDQDAKRLATKAKRLLERIEEVLSEATGDASGIIDAARAESTELKQRVEALADYFKKLLDRLPDDPQGRALMLERLWAEVRDEILTSPTIAKYYIRPADGKLILIIGRSAEIDQEIERWLRKAGDQQGPGGKK